MIGTGERVPCHEIREDGPYAGILVNCTREDPKRRFKSTAAVLDALVSVGADVSIGTAAGNQIVDLLARDAALDEKQWRGLVDFLERGLESQDAKAILVRLKRRLSSYMKQENLLAKSLRCIPEEMFLPVHSGSIGIL
jgi:eukaryotic-like serine/threonine-protein kinase